MTPTIFAIGNPDRGDDALGPQLGQWLRMTHSQIALIDDFHLQLEHIFDLQRAQLVLLLDAAIGQRELIRFYEVMPERSDSISSHGINPAALLHVYRETFAVMSPPTFLLTLRAAHFELGAPLSESSQRALQAAQELITKLLNAPDLQYWENIAIDPTLSFAEKELIPSSRIYHA